MWRSVLGLALAGCAFQAHEAGQPPDGSTTPDGSDGSDGSGATAKRRVTLTFANPRAEALANFAVLVALDATRIDYAACPGGANLRFTDPDGAALSYEIERWDPAGTSIVWVRVPQIDASSTTDFITMHWGDAALTDAQTPAQVWDHAALVYHLAEDPTFGTKDSTGTHAGTATPQMIAADLVDGKLGKAVRFDGMGGGIHAPSMMLPRFTWTMWLRADAAPAGTANHEPITDGDTNFNFAWDHSTPAYVGALAMHDTTMWHAAQGTGFAGATWYLLAGTYDGLQLCLHVDAAAPTCVNAGSPSTPTALFQLADATSNVATFKGILDEVRVYDVARSDLWLDADHASQTDTLITYGTAVPDL